MLTVRTEIKVVKTARTIAFYRRGARARRLAGPPVDLTPGRPIVPGIILRLSLYRVSERERGVTSVCVRVKTEEKVLYAYYYYY